jgi:hypothetical protein
MRTTTLFICMITCTALLNAQEDSLRVKPFQLSFFYPLGTSGIYSVNNGYTGSLNILTGITGAACGLEIGGLTNINRTSNTGVQIAGISNITGSYSKGAEFAGICNINGGFSTGFQVGGITNITGRYMTGGQIAGIANITGGKVNGFQIAGIINGNTDSVYGMQIAGVVNTARAVNGFQAAGIVNLTGNADACQVAGIANLSDEKASVQIAGVGNVAQEVEGIQIGGVFNVATTVKGVQLAGVINICDSIDGVPLALISIVRKNGYRRFDVWGSEALYLNLTYKIGIREIYSILSIGYKTGNRHNNTGLGVGLGTNMKLNNYNSIDLEAYFFQISNYLWMNEENFLYTLKLNYSRNLNERVAVFIGPTFNMLNTRAGSDAFDIAPGYGVTYKGASDWQYWAGFNAGIRF